MSGGGSKKGRVLKPYRYSSFWPRPAQEAVLDRAFMAWPMTIIPRYSDRNNLRFAL